MRITKEERAKLKAEHPDAILVRAKAGREELEFVLRPPTRGEFKRFEDEQRDNAPDFAENLTRACVLWPDEAAVARLFEKHPGVYRPLGDEIMRLAGAADKAYSEPL